MLIYSFVENGIAWGKHHKNSIYVSRFPAFDFYHIIRRKSYWELLVNKVDTLGYGRVSALMLVAEMHYVANYIPDSVDIWGGNGDIFKK